MGPHYIETPRTEASNATFVTDNDGVANRHGGISTMSIEKSFQSYRKDNDDLIKPRKGLTSLKTPRSRAPLADRRNGQPAQPPPKDEFTPLLRSVTKTNFLRGVPETPAYLKDGYRSNGNTPALPRLDSSAWMSNGENTGSDVDATPVPNMDTSSAQGTPLAALPRRDGGDPILGSGEDGVGMTLREQERIIDHVEKENFDLKLKIHFLEEALRKASPEFNSAALKENTELKVLKISMQKELHKYKKSLNQAEQDLEQYRMHLAQMQEKARRKFLDEEVKQEMELLRRNVEAKEEQIKELRQKLEQGDEAKEDELAKLRDDIGDLEADLREKERALDDRENEIEALKADAGRESDNAEELEDELRSAKKQIDELQADLERANATAQEALEERDEANAEKDHAEENLNELRDEMANKSFHTKGLSRQLEEKAAKQERELIQLRREYNELEEKFDEKVRLTRRLEERIQETEQDLNADKARYQDDLELAQHERDTAKRNCDQMSSRLQKALSDVRSISEQKDLLQSRHDTLTDESKSLQKDLAKAEASVAELEQAVQDEKQHTLNYEKTLRKHHSDEVQRLTYRIDELSRQVEDLERECAADRDHWESERRTLVSEKQRAEEKASGLSRTASKLQESEGTLSNRGTKLQEALESEKARHLQEEEVLNRQVKELNDDIDARRQNQEELRAESIRLREQLRIQKRDEANLHEKIQSLEDEIEVLQTSLDEELERVQNHLSEGRKDVDRQLQRALADKHTLRNQMADLNIELANLQASASQATADNEDIRLQLQEANARLEGRSRLGQEKSELRLAKTRLGNDVDKLNGEKEALSKANQKLQRDLEAEIERAAAEEVRLNDEINNLQATLSQQSDNRHKDLALARRKAERLETRVEELEDRIAEEIRKQNQPIPGRDRELTSAKDRAQRLEIRLHELEHRLLEQTAMGDTSAFEISTLHSDLAESRKRESKATKQQARLQQTVRALKSNVSALETQIQNLHSVKSSRDNAARQLEVENLRKELDQSKQLIKELRARNLDLERESMTEEERKDLHTLLKSSKLETEALSLRLSDREAKVDTLRAQLKRVREERSQHGKRADTAVRELESLQSELEGLYNRYESCLENMAGLQSEWDGERKVLLRAATGEADKKKHERELKGLAREIQWMRAKLEREKAFRQSLAWSKAYLGEEIRVRRHCNEENLRLISKMGVHAPRSLRQYQPSRFKAAVLAIQAVIRLQRLSSSWREARLVGGTVQREKGGRVSLSKEKKQRTPVRDGNWKTSGVWREI